MKTSTASCFSGAPCFSGACGLCSLCCRSDDKVTESEALRRAKDLSKFMGKQTIMEENDKYNKQFNQFMKQYNFRSPMKIGFTPKYMSYGKDIYTLIEKMHSAICDDSFCKVFYVNAHDNLKTNLYPKYPVYTRKEDDLCQLCGICVQNGDDDEETMSKVLLMNLKYRGFKG